MKYIRYGGQEVRLNDVKIDARQLLPHGNRNDHEDKKNMKAISLNGIKIYHFLLLLFTDCTFYIFLLATDFMLF